ncbi:MAG: hypothetical protein ACXACC_03655 [Promethearchaeota archaeon]|jgi:hypothetical protein
MVYFQVSRVGFNCGIDKNKCSNYPDGCIECVKAHFVKFGCEINQNIKINEINSEEKRIQMFQDLIWQKFLDVLNIKHILLMIKDTGLPIVDYPISGAGVDVGFLTGFIQANITFSESGKTSKSSTTQILNHKFYEFQYETFNILLKNGKLIRLCLVLDRKASNSLKNLVSEFLTEYETRYQDKLEKLIKMGALDFNDTIDFIIDTFNIKLVFPMVLTHTFLPNVLESINKNHIQKAIVDFSKEILVSRQVFFINNLLNKVQEVVNIDASIILYEIYQLLIGKVIIPTNIETAANEIKKFHELQATRIANNELISPIIANDNAVNELKGKANTMSEEEARKLMETFIKKGETVERSLAFKEAQKEYEKALYLATGFDFKLDIGRISFMVLELDKKVKNIELDYAVEAGEKAEKKKDYINAISNFKQALKIIEFYGNESKIKKMEKRIIGLQKYV